jgi:hypothetical protein
MATAIVTNTTTKTIHSVGEPLSNASDIRFRFRFTPPLVEKSPGSPIIDR